MQLTNLQCLEMIESLKPMMTRRDIIGYAAARNTRRLADACQDYMRIRESLLVEYGEQVTGPDGKPTGEIVLSSLSGNFPKYQAEIEQIEEVANEVDVFRIDYSEVVNRLTGDEIIAIDWMLKDGDAE